MEASFVRRSGLALSVLTVAATQVVQYLSEKWNHWDSTYIVQVPEESTLTLATIAEAQASFQDAIVSAVNTQSSQSSQLATNYSDLDLQLDEIIGTIDLNILIQNNPVLQNLPSADKDQLRRLMAVPAFSYARKLTIETISDLESTLTTEIISGRLPDSKLPNTSTEFLSTAPAPEPFPGISLNATPLPLLKEPTVTERILRMLYDGADVLDQQNDDGADVSDQQNQSAQSTFWRNTTTTLLATGSVGVFGTIYLRARLPSLVLASISIAGLLGMQLQVLSIELKTAACAPVPDDSSTFFANPGKYVKNIADKAFSALVCVIGSGAGAVGQFSGYLVSVAAVSSAMVLGVLLATPILN